MCTGIEVAETQAHTHKKNGGSGYRFDYPKQPSPVTFVRCHTCIAAHPGAHPPLL